MNTRRLVLDYLERAKKRRDALRLLLKEEAYADVVRESQEIFELILKGVMRYIGIEPPKRHDVGPVLKEYKDKLPEYWQDVVEEAVEISRDLMEERSHAFYGDETELVPASELFTKEDADRASETIDRFLILFEMLVKKV